MKSTSTVVPRCPPGGVMRVSFGVPAGERRADEQHEHQRAMRMSASAEHARAIGEMHRQRVGLRVAVSLCSWLAADRDVQPSRSFTTSPPSMISIGRPPGAISSLSALMPSWWYTVVSTSSTRTGFSSGSLAVEFDEP